MSMMSKTCKKHESVTTSSKHMLLKNQKKQKLERCDGYIVSDQHRLVATSSSSNLYSKYKIHQSVTTSQKHVFWINESIKKQKLARDKVAVLNFCKQLSKPSKTCKNNESVDINRVTDVKHEECPICNGVFERPHPVQGCPLWPFNYDLLENSTWSRTKCKILCNTSVIIVNDCSRPLI